MNSMKHAICFILLFALPVMAQEASPDAQYVVFMGETGVIVMKFDITIAGKSTRQSFESYVDDLMKSLDQNGDGVVTTDEARGKYLTAREAIAAQLIPAGASVRPDENPDVSPADGKISRQEFLTYFRRIKLEPFLMRFQANAAPQMANRQPRQVANTADIPLFARLDTNRDGKLSADELTDALRTLRKLDLDDDETISAAELSPINDPFAVQQQIRQTATNAPSTSPFLGHGSEETMDSQANRLIRKYKTGNQGRSLSAKELGISATAFARFDGDGDGQLDSDELKQFLLLPEPTLSLVIAVDSTEPLKAMSAAVELKDKLRTTADGAANINLGSTQLSVVRTSSFDLGNVEVFLKPQFMAADADANGYLEKSETDRAFLYGATFEELDADKNGKVFLDEIVTFLE